MDYALRVEVNEGSDYLFHVNSDLFFRYSLCPDLPVEFASGHEFQNEGILILEVVNLVNLDDVGMVEHSHDGEFLYDFFVLYFVELFLFYNFGRPDDLSMKRSDFIHNAETPSANFFYHFIIS